MANSSDVTAGNDAQAQEYNDLRKDVLNTSSGHSHDGADSKILATDSVDTIQIVDGAITYDKLAISAKVFGTMQAVASGSTTSTSYQTLINITAENKGYLLSLFFGAGIGYYTRARIKLTIDSIELFADLDSNSEEQYPSGAFLTSAGGSITQTPYGGGATYGKGLVPSASSAVNIPYAHSLKIEYRAIAGSATVYCRAVYTQIT